MRHQLLLAVIAGVMFFTNLGGAHLWDVDEAIFSQAAKEMMDRGDHVVPYFNGHLFPDKPPVMYWAMISAYQTFGATEFAARFWSAVFGVASVLVTYRLGRLLFSPAAGFWAGVALASNLNFNVIARAATPDSYLTFFCTLAVLVFVAGTAKARVQAGQLNPRNAPWAGQTRFEPSWPCYALCYAVMGCGMLTKGPVGVVLPTAVIGLFLLVMRARPVEPAVGTTWRDKLGYACRWCLSVFGIPHIFRTIWSMRPLTAVAMVLLVAGPWYVLVGMATQGEWLVGFFGVHNLGRFVNAMDNHRGPIVYYVAAICIGFFPWSVLFGPGLVAMRQQLATNAPWRAGYVLVASWIAVWVGFFSLAGTKLPSYVLPAYPALALFTGALIDLWLREPALVSRVWPRLIWSCVALAGVGLLIAFPIVAHLYLADDWGLALLGLVPLACAIGGWMCSRQGQTRRAMGVLAGCGLAFSLLLFAFGAAYVDRYQDSARFAELIRSHTPAGQQALVGSYRYFRPSFVFYTQQSIEEFPDVERVQSFFATPAEAAFLFTTDEQYEKLRSTLPSDVQVVEARPRFLRRGQVILLGRAPALAKRPASTSESVPGSLQ